MPRLALCCSGDREGGGGLISPRNALHVLEVHMNFMYVCTCMYV